ncbi:Fic/DOC family protein [Radiobacillus sp. PE A8.2]|uniref:Fic/DOC family protein n=1 Tax=Radiobacillus sp. PE A8.2 TaxID=3380349 RepID=UPI00388DD63F
MNNYFSPDDPYCYQGTNILINKKNIREQSMLDKLERIYSAKRLLQLSNKPIVGLFDLAHLQKIHHFIFQDIYNFAGEIRTVNIGKGLQFCEASNIIPYFYDEISIKLKDGNYLSDLNREQFSKRAGHFLGEINAVHPFREGNGRSQREFIRTLAYKNGFMLDWSRVSAEAMIHASIESLVRSSDLLIPLIQKAILNDMPNKRLIEKYNSHM